MGKLFGLISILVGMYLGMQIYTEGIDGMLGSLMDPIESSERDSSSFGGHLTGGDVTMPTERKRGPVTQRVREKVTADLQLGAERRGY
ncbi:MAG: hypothetical protein JRH19_22155 [Deltaproteobacteria bacterium]|nr:hypothetical protein [Deltaproteobacteria bacterium]